MQTPAFFATAPTIELIDPLAGLLGAATDGLVTYTYGDAVKLAGHSCPTVAGAFLMTMRALAHLYRGETPTRGAIQVSLREPIDEGVTGVTGAVMGLITGAAGPGGFKGIRGAFRRSGLLSYGVRQDATARLQRVDTGASVGVDFDPNVVPPSPEQGPLMQRVLADERDGEARRRFAELWQERVATMMTTEALWPQLVKLS